MNSAAQLEHLKSLDICRNLKFWEVYSDIHKDELDHLEAIRDKIFQNIANTAKFNTWTLLGILAALLGILILLPNAKSKEMERIKSKEKDKEDLIDELHCFVDS
jgi:hypothetical protein